MDTADLQRLAPPGVTALVVFLAYSSQWLFYQIEPGPLSEGDAYLFNILVICLLISYWRTCLTDPGRIPADWRGKVQQSWSKPEDLSTEKATLSNRWCRRCEAFKPPRAHHCKTCQRCIMKMDHHCVWTANCISHITIPHFIRFLSYAVAAMTQLEYFIYLRGAVLWDKRRLPSYLGPTPLQLAHLFILFSANSLVLFLLVILLARTLWSLFLNTWTIEGWEIERHHTLLRRARTLGRGGTLPGPDGRPVAIVHQEFPWDVGIWSNLCQGMGSANPLVWVWPLAGSPSVESGLVFRHNEIDDPSKPWPPPDPDRLYKFLPRQPIFPGDADAQQQPNLDPASFRQRQAADLARQQRQRQDQPAYDDYYYNNSNSNGDYHDDDDIEEIPREGFPSVASGATTMRYTDAAGEYVVRRKPFHERFAGVAADGRPRRREEEEEAYDYYAGNRVAVSDEGEDEDDDDVRGEYDSPDEHSEEEADRGRARGPHHRPANGQGRGTVEVGEEAWRNREGERLADFGVDEEADFYDERDWEGEETSAAATATGNDGDDDVPLGELLRRRKGGG